MKKSTRAIVAEAARRSLLAVMVVLLGGLVQPSQGGTFFDDFDDGNADGWVFPYNSSQTQFPGGVWSVEDGTLVQHTGTDGNNGLVDNLVISDQVIEAQMHTVGYAGVVLWYQQVDNDWANFVAVFHNYQTGMWVGEMIDGHAYGYSYGGPWIGSDTWYDLRVEADSATGNLTVDLDGVSLFTHVARTPYRTGLSGVYSGNEHGYFDNFRVTSNDIPLSVSIDIQNGSDVKRINLKSNGRIQVAILSSSELDAPTQVDRPSLTFGRTGAERSLVSCAPHPKDVNGDGLPDLVCSFSTRSAAFQAGDTQGVLKGRTSEGLLLIGFDSVQIVPDE